MSQKESPKKRLRFDKKITLLSVAILIVIVTPAQAVHELGHAGVCAMKGFTYTMSIDAFGAYLTCHGAVENNLAFKSLGGMIAGLTFLLPVAIRKVRSTAWLFIPLLTVSIGHFANAFVETAFYESYISGDPMWSGVLMMSSYATFAALLIKYGRT